MRDNGVVQGIGDIVGSYWWLVFVIGPVVGGTLQQHHRRRLAILEAKAQLADRKNAARLPAEPQPICGCSHHLSFHKPQTSACAVEDCRCQQYVGPEPLGHVFAQPLIDPEIPPLPREPGAAKPSPGPP
jgi:hypothetical protein